MPKTNMTLRTSLLALLLAAPLATPALAEQHSSGDDTAMDSADSDMPTAAEQDDTSAAVGTDGAAQADPLIVTVGDTKITASDIEAALMAFPPQIRQTQPPEMLIPMAVEQLILRELVLQAAMSDNLAEDEDVQRILEEDDQRTEEDAMVQVYVEREMEGVVTEEAVQQAYDAVAENSETEVPPLDAVRPQIERQLQQQRMTEMGERLGQSVEIVFYGPDGQPQQAESDAPDGSTMGNGPIEGGEGGTPEVPDDTPDGGTDGSDGDPQN